MYFDSNLKYDPWGPVKNEPVLVNGLVPKKYKVAISSKDGIL